MSSNRISFFNRLEDTDLHKRIKFIPGPYRASYEYDGRVELDVKTDDYDLRKFNILDDKALWDISKDGLILKREIKIGHPRLLFGDSGIADSAATLGIATVCTSTESDRLEVFKLFEFDSECATVDISSEIELGSGKYRGNAILETVLYLVENNEEDSRFPKQSGTIMGTLDRYDMDIRDDRQLFPVYEVSESESPLWWAACNWYDIEEDAFVKENIAIVINNSHPMYKYIEFTDAAMSTFNPGYAAEVISSSIHAIIEKMKESTEEWDRIISNASFREGTIAYMVKYMKDTFEWDFSSPELTAKSIRNHVYSRMLSK